MMLEKSIKNPTTQPLPTTQLRLLSPMSLGFLAINAMTDGR